jgi:hypothetical protein
MEYQLDEAQAVHFLKTAIHHHTLTPLGLMSSLGVHNPPLFIYLLLPLSFVSTHPLFLAVTIAFLNSLLIGFLYWLLRPHYPKGIVFSQALILATSPWAIIFSRKIWAQDLILLFAVPIFYLLHHKLKPKAIALLIAILVLNSQLHLSGLFLFLAFIIVFSKDLLPHRPSIIKGIIIGLIPLLPYLHYQLSQKPPCPDCQNLIAHTQAATNFDLHHFTLPPQILTGLAFELLLGQPLSKIYNPVFFMIVIITLFGAYHTYRHHTQRWLVLVPFIYLLSLTLTKTPAHLHYYVNLIPFIALLFIFGVASLTRNHPKLFSALISLIVFTNLAFIFSFFQFLKSNPITSGVYGPTYSQSSQWVNQATSDYRSRSDYDAILLAAHLSTPTLPIKSLADVHANLAFYFYQTGEASIVKTHLTHLPKKNPANQRFEQLKQLLQNH